MDFNYANITSDFLSEEIRDGYLVTNTNKKIWAIELDLLAKLLDVCKNNGIKVFAFAGTLLGAVRHHGFIPWDDDIDVCMLQEDFIKLERIAKDEFESPYFLQTARTDPRYFFGYARLRNSDTTGIINWNASLDYNNGIYVDIFVLNGIPEDDKRLIKLLNKRDFIHKLLNTYYKSYRKKGIKKIGQSIISSLLQKVIDYDSLIDIYRNTLSTYDNEPKRYALLTHDWDFIHKYWCPTYSFEKTVELPFECISIPAPLNYNEILINIYGDYMRYPPVDERGKWHQNMVVYDPDVSYIEYMKLHENLFTNSK